MAARRRSSRASFYDFLVNRQHCSSTVGGSVTVVETEQWAMMQRILWEVGSPCDSGRREAKVSQGLDSQVRHLAADYSAARSGVNPCEMVFARMGIVNYCR